MDSQREKRYNNKKERLCNNISRIFIAFDEWICFLICGILVGKGGMVMARKRTIPFGYCMKNGEITIEPKEVYAIATIFSEYLNGKSLIMKMILCSACLE